MCTFIMEFLDLLVFLKQFLVCFSNKNTYFICLASVKRDFRHFSSWILKEVHLCWGESSGAEVRKCFCVISFLIDVRHFVRFSVCLCSCCLILCFSAIFILKIKTSGESLENSSLVFTGDRKASELMGFGTGFPGFQCSGKLEKSH